MDVHTQNVNGVAKKVLDTMSSNAAKGVATNDGDNLFSLKVISADAVDINSVILSVEAYICQQLKIVNSEVVEDEQVEIAEDVLQQNEENPFKESTVTSYELASKEVIFTISGIASKVMKVINTEGAIT